MSTAMRRNDAGAFYGSPIHLTLPIIKPEGDFVYPVHYFPSATVVEQASPVSLKVGEDRTEIDIAAYEM